MARGTEQQVVEEIVSLIEANISDVNSERAGTTKWVYDDLPKADITKYPRISVVAPTGESEYHGLGDNTERRTPMIEIQIRIKKGEKHTIDGVLKRDIQVVDYLQKEVSDLLRQQSSLDQLRDNQGVFWLSLQTQNTIQDNIITKQLIYEITFLK